MINIQYRFKLGEFTLHLHSYDHYISNLLFFSHAILFVVYPENLKVCGTYVHIYVCIYK